MGTDLLLLLYALNYAPIQEDQYTQAIVTAREAFIVQTGARAEYDRVEAMAKTKLKEVRVLRPLILASWLYKTSKDKKATLRTKVYGLPLRIEASKQTISISLTIPF